MGVLAWEGAGAQTLAREVTVDPSAVHFRDANGLVQVVLRGAYSGLRPGDPDLPLLPVALRLPEGTAPASVRVVPLESVDLPGTRRLVAVPQPSTTAVPLTAAVSPDPEAWWPRDPFYHIHSGRMRGEGILQVLVSPLAWRAADGGLRLTTRFRVEVVLQPRDPDPGDLTIRRESDAGRRSFGPTLARLTGTPAAATEGPRLVAATPQGAAFSPTFRPSLDGSPVEMVIITTDDQVAEYQRLADFKTRTGLCTVVRTVEWIEANYPHGVDTQETIRNFIRDAASRWGTAWILLGGDTERVPVRFAFSKIAPRLIPTDLYYSDLDGNWNANGDDRFGEGRSTEDPGDMVDLYPDVWVGRLPSKTAAEAQILVDKTLTYEQDPPLGYQNDMLFLGEVLFPDTWVPGQGWTVDGAAYCELAVDTLQVQNRPVRLYENYTNYPGSLPEMKSAVIDSVNAGFNLVVHVGHGYVTTMSVGLEHKTLVNADVESFTNGAEQGLLYALDCTSCAIQYNCIGERFLLNPNGGAVSVIGSTEVEYPVTGIQYQVEFMNALFHENVHEIGRTMAVSKIHFIPSSDYDSPHRWTQFGQINLGDPSLPFWTDVPGTLTVSRPTSFTLGQDVFALTVGFQGSPAESARVAVYKDGEVYAVGLANSLGQAVLPANPVSAGSLSVGISYPGALPYLAEVPVVVTTAPYLRATGVDIVDDGSGSTVGSGDMRLDAGETAELLFTVANNGSLTETGITGSLSVPDPRVTVLDADCSFPDLLAGQSAVASDPFLIQIDGTIPDLLEVPATLTLNGASGSDQQTWRLYLHAPVYRLEQQTIRDTVGNGNGDGIVQTNEDFVLLPRIRNIGHGAARSVVAHLRSSDPAVTVTDSTAVLGDLAPEATGENPADGLQARLSDLTTEHELLLVVADADGETVLRRLDVNPPGAPGTPRTVGAATSVALSWGKSPDPDLWGYAIYRSPSESGPFVRVNDWVAERTAYFEDDGLPPLTQFHYRVAAIDSSGNESPLSGIAPATTTLPIHAGWPIQLTTSTPAGISVADLDGVPGFEIMGAANEIYVVTPDGQDYLDGDLDARTLGPITDTGGATFWDTPAVGDVDGDGHAEIAAVGWNDGLVYLVDDTGKAKPGWPRNGNPLAYSSPNPVGSVCLADLDGDGHLEVLCAVGKNILGWHADGTELIDGDNDPATDGVVAVTGANFSYGTPSAANIDLDPRREIIAGMRDGKLYVFHSDGTPYPGFPFATGGDISTSPAIGDLDGDGLPEIVFGSSDSLLRAIRYDLSSAPGFPRQVALDEDWDSSPALGDLNGDGRPDVVIGSSDGKVYAISGADGSDLPGFPVLLTDSYGNPVATRSSPALGDVDGDGWVDIVIGDQDGRLHGFDHTGQVLAGFFIQTGGRIQNTPVIWDTDGDGMVEVLVESGDQRMYCWNSPGAFDPGRIPWPMQQGNAQHTGQLGDAAARPETVGVPTPETPPAVLLANYPNPFSRATAIRFRVPDGGPARVRLTVFDLSGRVVRTLLDGERPPGVQETDWDGRDAVGREVSSGIYLYRLQVAGTDRTRKMILIRH